MISRTLRRDSSRNHANRLHRLAQAGEVPLDIQGSHILKVLDPQRRAEPLEGPGVPVYRAGRAVADASAKEVSICFLGLFWRGRIVKTLDDIGLVETRGFELLTPCVQIRFENIPPISANGC